MNKTAGLAIDPLMKPEEVCAILRVPVRMVYRMVREGRLPAIRVGRLMRFQKSEMSAFTSGSLVIHMKKKKVKQRK